MGYLNRLSRRQLETLLTEMRISMEENVENLPYAYYGGKLHIVHGETDSGRTIESVYKDFEIETIYNSEPSEYDQRKFKNCMIILLQNTDYYKDLKAYFADLEKKYEEERKRNKNI